MKYIDFKKLCESILSEEIDKHNLNIKSYSFGRLSYYNSSYFKEGLNRLINTRGENGLRLTSLYCKVLLSPIMNTGYFSYDDDTLVIFLNDIVDINFSNDIVDLLRNVYHELYHAIDHRNIDDGYYEINYNVFASSIDHFLRDHYVGHFLKYKFTRKGYDSCMFEILADIYATKKVDEFIKANPDMYDYNVSKLNKYKQKCYDRYIAYDLTKRLDFIIKNYNDIKKCSDFDDSIFKLFLDENGHFKSLEELNLDERIKALDFKIVNAFMNTNAFRNGSSLRNNELQNDIEESKHK